MYCMLFLNFRLNQNPWGNFAGTYQLPDKLTRKYGNVYNKCLNTTNVSKDQDEFGISGTALKCPTKCEATARLIDFDQNRKKALGFSGKKEVNIMKQF